MSVSGKTIIIDPGHGGRDPGTVNGNIYESNVNLNVAKALKTKLEAKGAVVCMTRTSNTIPWPTPEGNVNDRVAYINGRYGTSYNALVSVHLNRAYGASGAFFQEGNSSRLAKNIALCMRPRATYYSEDFAILGNTLGDHIPKALVETGHIADPNITTTTWVKNAAEAICQGLNNIL